MRSARALERPSTEMSETQAFPWAKLTEADLLKLRIRDLGLTVEGFEKSIDGLYRELDCMGIDFHPPCYLADDWLCPDEVPAIGIPFFLAHPRLKRLEMKMMLEVEGGTRPEFMRILRHECGHTMNYAFLLHRRTRWRKLFGSFKADYKESYRIRPYSRKFVRNLDNFYAQMHPDEDFAETFAVWLDPGRSWKSEHAGWGALAKLEYVDELMREEVAGWQPQVVAKKRQFLWRADKMQTTLELYYKKRRAEYAWEYPDFFDPDLKRLFPPTDSAGAEPAGRFLRRRRKDFLSDISRWSRESKFNISRIMGDLIERCEELDLRVGRPETEAVLEVTAYLTSLVVHYFHTGELTRHG